MICLLQYLMAPSKKRKEPQVIVFEDPEEKYRTKQREKKQDVKKDRKKKNDKGFNVKDHYQEIIEFSKSVLTGKAKNDYELEKIGALRTKKPHFQLKTILRLKAKRQQKEREQKRFEKTNHIVAAVKHKERKQKVQREENLFSQPGKFKDGVLYVDPKLIS